MNINITAKELAKGSRWAKKHAKEDHGGDLNVSFYLIPAGGPIGTRHDIACVECHETKDITDYKLW